MPYTVPAAFDGFFKNINLTGDHRSTANARRDRIVSLLKKEFTILEAFATGSVPRFTAVRGYADLDVIVTLHYSKHIKDESPADVLLAVREVLARYKTRVRRNGQAVTLYYESWPNVDIVPASRSANDAGEVTSYSIPDMNRGVWLSSKPKRHSKNIADRSSICGESFRKIVKMIKWWNQKHSAYLQSYHIEAMAMETFSGPLSDMSWDVYCFFKSACTMASSSLWYNGSFVDSYMDFSSRLGAVERLTKARDLAKDAWYLTYDANDQHEEAIKIWRKVFGDKFPEYGA